METFSVDKSFYDIGTSDLKELWDSDLDPAISEVLKVASDADLEWTATLLDVKPQVILHDRLMTDAALGTAPIKTEHSYSLTSDGDSIPDSPLSLDNKMDDMENECFPCIPLNTATGRSRESESPLIVKEEPMSEPESPESCPMSPSSPLPLPLTHIDARHEQHKTGNQQSILKQPTILLATRTNLYTSQNRLVIPKLNIKLEPNAAAGFSLPPTPPSSTTSDNEGNVSPDHNPSSPSRHIRQQQQQQQHNGTTRLFLPSNSSSAPTTTNRQPIQTPLISNQPKGSTGMLMLTEEEKRTLLAEGYPIPTRLPLTKAEEKSLKKIRRKIKNKISAQESRRKKKEYMDALERKVEVLTSENTDYKKKIENLEDSNATLLSQLQKLQALVARSSTSSTTGTTSRTVRHMESTSFNISHMNHQHITRSSIK